MEGSRDRDRKKECANKDRDEMMKEIFKWRMSHVAMHLCSCSPPPVWPFNFKMSENHSFSFFAETASGLCKAYLIKKF